MEDDAVYQRAAILRAQLDSDMNLDLSDDLLFGGCWIETTDYSDFSLAASTSPFFGTSGCMPSPFIEDGNTNLNSPRNIEENEKDGSLFPDNQIPVEFQLQNLVGNQLINRNVAEIANFPDQFEFYPAEGDGNNSRMINLFTESSNRLWIEPLVSPCDPSSSVSVKRRLIQALNFINDSTRDGDVLVQIWVPTQSGRRQVLSTYGQPFCHDVYSQRLGNYRTVSTSYQFSTEVNSNETVGLPGRVFLGRLPEWSPDVRYFSKEEFARVGHAQQNGVCGTLALPIFEQWNRACLGVVEVVMTTPRINYRTELESICNALQAVNLTSFEVLNVPHMKERIHSYQAALPEIVDVLRAVCETHRLPLAQTWVPCIEQGKKGIRHSDDNYTNCISTVDEACYVTDTRMWGFHEACSEHHLLRGEGVVGKALTTNQPCFSTNITVFNKSEYPLSHYARMFGLRAAVAIRLRSLYTNGLDYVLEFFLPVECKDSEGQKLMLSSLSGIIQKVSRNLRVVTDRELEQESVLHINKLTPGSVLGKSSPCEDGRHSGGKSPETLIEESSCISDSQWAQKKGKSTVSPISWPSESHTQEHVKFNSAIQWEKHGEVLTKMMRHHQDSGRDNFEHRESPFVEQGVMMGATEKRRMKVEKNISLQVLRQHFAGSLKDAAKSIGVCPTTLKRICRQHGITRWPSRKIKKVSHSLRKLQLVIDSVHGADGAFQISSLYRNIPKASGPNFASPNLSGDFTSSALNQAEPPTPSTTQPQGIGSIGPTASKSISSSCSQTSSSSLCYSSGAEQSPYRTPLAATEDMSMETNQSSMLKRAHSEANLHRPIEEEQRLPARSHSPQSLNEQPGVGHLSPLYKSNTQFLQDRVLKVKVAYEEEKVRFSLQPSGDFQDLVQEIQRRFSIKDMSAMDIKYLDDESEWVLLTCDADLEECKYMYLSFPGHTLKLLLHQKNSSSRNSWTSTGWLS